MADGRRMGKSELFSHFAERFAVKRGQAREFFDELQSLAETELKRSGEFVLPGMGEAGRPEAQSAYGTQSRHGRDDQDPGKDCREGPDRQTAQGLGSTPQLTQSASLAHPARRGEPGWR